MIVIVKIDGEAHRVNLEEGSTITVDGKRLAVKNGNHVKQTYPLSEVTSSFSLPQGLCGQRGMNGSGHVGTCVFLKLHGGKHSWQ